MFFRVRFIKDVVSLQKQGLCVDGRLYLQASYFVNVGVECTLTLSLLLTGSRLLDFKASKSEWNESSWLFRTAIISVLWSFEVVSDGRTWYSTQALIPLQFWTKRQIHATKRWNLFQEEYFSGSGKYALISLTDACPVHLVFYTCNFHRGLQ